MQRSSVRSSLLLHLLLAVGLLTTIVTHAQQTQRTGVLVIGGGTGGTAAGIQSARLGVPTIIVEPTPWLGGMLSAAGVSATDGNHRLPSGIWGEFRNQLYKVYGGAQQLATGWVSNTQFEPHVADSIFKVMARKEKQLQVLYGWQLVKCLMHNHTVQGALFTNSRNEQLQIDATVVIDATELGDVMAAAGVPFDIGLEADSSSGEKVGIASSSNIIQDLTYVAILKDFGPKADCTITRPYGYQPAEFDGACSNYYMNPIYPAPAVDAQKMLDYGKLPNNKYMLNWPNRGNDAYVNMIALSPAERLTAAEPARQTTLRFVYFIQHELGYKHLGLATDEFPTADRLALIPYHREGRRLKGLVRLTSNEIAAPFDGWPLYRTGIAVGDYPIDHHHKKHSLAPQHLSFYPIPSYNVPLGALIPATTDGLVVAEKGISVSNVVNGTTRLQPCVLLTGQAAGVLAALSVQEAKQPRQVATRQVQQQLLRAGAYLMPYIDVPLKHPHFMAIQKMGATGILRGRGVPYKWANQTWFDPDSTVSVAGLFAQLPPYASLTAPAGKQLSIQQAIGLVAAMAAIYQHVPRLQPLVKLNRKHLLRHVQQQWPRWQLRRFHPARAITKAELAVLLDNTIDPFTLLAPDAYGNVTAP